MSTLSFDHDKIIDLDSDTGDSVATTNALAVDDAAAEAEAFGPWALGAGALNEAGSAPSTGATPVESADTGGASDDAAAEADAILAAGAGSSAAPVERAAAVAAASDGAARKGAATSSNAISEAAAAAAAAAVIKNGVYTPDAAADTLPETNMPNLPSDGFFASQWHLRNTAAGEFDLRLFDGNTSVWDEYTGNGVRVVVIDDGVDVDHYDLNDNYDASLAVGTALQQDGPSFDSAHGTAVAGIIAAEQNGVGVVGVAHESTIWSHAAIPARDISNDGEPPASARPPTEDAFNNWADWDVANGSYGFSSSAAFYNQFWNPDVQASYQAVTAAAINGRGGLGSIFIKSAGNDRQNDGNTVGEGNNGRWTSVSVAAVDRDGTVSAYSTEGAGLLVSAFGSPFQGQVVTTDRDEVGRGYTRSGANDDIAFSFNGTSAAAPMVSGVVALMLEANPDLGYRDIQHILAATARHVGGNTFGNNTGNLLTDERYTWEWNDSDQWNGGGMHFSEDYGYGLVDALAAVRLAESWTDQSVHNNRLFQSVNAAQGQQTVDNGTINYTFNFSNFNATAEHIGINLRMEHNWLADLDITLTSPNGTVSEIMRDNFGSQDAVRYTVTGQNVTFHSTMFRGEDTAGTWTLSITDDTTGIAGTFSNVQAYIIGNNAANDTYVYTNEFSNFATPARRTLNDTDGGIDEINAAAVSSNSIIRLTTGQTSTIDGENVLLQSGIIENAQGGDGNDFIVGNAVNNTLWGHRGGDIIDGQGGNDTLYGGAANDSLRGGSGADDLYGGAGYDYADYRTATTGVVADLANASANTGDATGDRYFSIAGIQGSNFGDSLRGTDGTNTLIGYAGNDFLYARGGNDFLIGSDGDDFLLGGTGGDSLNGGGGFDRAGYWQASARVIADLANASVNTGEAAGDTYISIEGLYGTGFNDILYGNGGANRLDGWTGTDTLYGRAGNDELYGGNDNDILVGGAGGDLLNGGAGFDYASYFDAAAGLIIDMGTPSASTGDAAGDTFTSIESIIGSNFGDSIRGDNNDNRLSGRNGNDALYGRDGDDLLSGGNGNDILVGGAGGDDLFGSAGIDRASYFDATAGVVADLANSAANTGYAAGDTYSLIEDLYGSRFGDSLRGDNGNNRLFGVNGNDGLFGRGGNDSLYGGNGNDVLAGGSGGDLLNGGAGFDRASYFDASAGVLVDFANVGINSGDAAGDTFSGIEGIYGSAFNDSLRGNGGANRLEGANGNDFLLGRGGNDTLFGGNGNDTLAGSSGADLLNGGGGIDRASYFDASTGLTADLQISSNNTGDAAGDTYVSIENLYGTGGADSLRGDGGDNRIDGVNGNDTLFGRNGDDTLVGGNGNDTLIGGRDGDALFGGAGVDLAGYSDATAGVIADLQIATLNTGYADGDTYNSIEGLIGSRHVDSLRGDAGNNRIFAGNGNDFVYGRDGIDYLYGQNGNDNIVGGNGRDTIYTGAGRDIVRYFNAGESTASQTDRVMDFTRGLDKIHLSAVDANGGAAGNGLFWVGGAGFSGTAGEVRFSGGTVQVDTTGNGLANMEIDLIGITSLSQSDFIGVA